MWGDAETLLPNKNGSNDFNTEGHKVPQTLQKWFAKVLIVSKGHKKEGN